jgi:hypothetical protein
MFNAEDIWNKAGFATLGGAWGLMERINQNVLIFLGFAPAPWSTDGIEVT